MATLGDHQRPIATKTEGRCQAPIASGGPSAINGGTGPSDLTRAIERPDAQIVDTAILMAERDAAMAALAAAEQRYRGLIDAMGAAVYTTDVDGRLTLYNEAAAALWGQHPKLGDARFCGAWRLQTIDESPMPHDECPMAVSLREKRPIAGGEAIAERPDGTRVTFAAYPAPLRDASGEVVGAVNVLVDITERKSAEAALRQSDDHRHKLGRLNQDLEARVRSEVLCREAAQQQLAQARRLEALGRLAGGIAHDFNNVLQAVQGALTLIERGTGSAEDVERHARRGLEAAARGSSVTQRLLIFSRRGELRAETIDPRTLFNELSDMLSHTLGAGIELRTEVAPDLPCLTADRGQLETVLINLATNARDAMPDGGTLTFAAGVETVAAGGSAWSGPGLRAGRYVRLDVLDTGVGMDAATLARVSEPFFTTKALGKGTGLGMAMAQGFVEQSGGSLYIASKQRQGTRVTLWLPVAEPHLFGVPKSAVSQDADARARAGGRLLLVDDEKVIRETLAELLEDDGYDVIATESGLRALDLLNRDEPVDLLVSDLSMPEMDGLTFIRQAQRRRPGLPAILLTGHADDEAVFGGNRATRADFSLLRKPVTANQLLGCVELLLKAKRGQTVETATE